MIETDICLDVDGFSYNIYPYSKKAAIVGIRFDLFIDFPNIPKEIMYKGGSYEVNSLLFRARYCGRTQFDLIIIPDHITELGFGIFQDCKIKKIILGTGLTSLPSRCFSYSEVDEVIFKQESKITTIKEDCFDNCKNLRKIDLPNSVRKLEEFSFWCCSLEEISLPSIDLLGNSSFTYCKNLKRVFFKDKLPPTKRLVGKAPTRIFSRSKGVVKPTLFISNSEIKAVGDQIVSNPYLKIQTYRPSTNELYSEILKYEILDPEKKECGVTFNIDSSGNNVYTGDIIIPSVVILGGSIYKVVRLMEFSFYNCSNLSSIDIPKNMIIDATALEENNECLIIERDYDEGVI